MQKVARWFPSSKLCHLCQVKNEGLKLSEREWTCANCGASHERDFNAALNIKIEGERLHAGNGFFGVTPVGGKALACALV